MILGTNSYKPEAALVGSLLVIVAYFTATPDHPYVGWIGSAAVFLTFMHIQIADRLAEAEGERMSVEYDEGTAAYYKSQVGCYWKLKWYLVAKEFCWLIYFVSLGAWSALVGVGLFLSYPAWRHLYRKHIRSPRA